MAFRVSFSPSLLSLFLFSSPLTLALEVCLAELTLIVVVPVDFLFGLPLNSLTVATPELLLALYAERFSLKLLSYTPVLVLIMSIFLD